MVFQENQYLLPPPPPVRKEYILPLFEAFSSSRSIKQTRPCRRGSFKELADVTTPLIFNLAQKLQYPSANAALQKLHRLTTQISSLTKIGKGRSQITSEKSHSQGFFVLFCFFK